VKRYLALLLLLLCTELSRADTFRLRNGSTVSGTARRGGGEQVILDTPYGAVTYKVSDFDDATKAKLDRYNAAAPPPGAVTQAAPVSAPRSVPAIERAESTPKPPPVDLRKLPQTPAKLEAFNQALQGPRLLVFYGGVALMLLGGIWFLVRAFQESLWWGLACLICNFPSLIFLFLHWNRAKEPFFLQLVGLAASCVALYVMK